MTNEAGGKTGHALIKHGPGLLATTMVVIVVSLLTAVGVVAVYDQRYAQKVVTMDLKGYIRSQRDMAMRSEVTDEQLRKNIDAMEAALLAEPANHTVLLKEVVLRNAREIKP
jgi:hypothetical protein